MDDSAAYQRGLVRVPHPWNRARLHMLQLVLNSTDLQELACRLDACHTPSFQAPTLNELYACNLLRGELQSGHKKLCNNSPEHGPTSRHWEACALPDILSLLSTSAWYIGAQGCRARGLQTNRWQKHAESCMRNKRKLYILVYGCSCESKPRHVAVSPAPPLLHMSRPAVS